MIRITAKVAHGNMQVSQIFPHSKGCSDTITIALEPRYLGGCAVIARSFARIHETNCKKQGLLPLTFTNEKDYDRVQSTDKVDLVGVTEIAPGSKITMKLTHKDGSTESIELQHTFKSVQIFSTCLKRAKHNRFPVLIMSAGSKLARHSTIWLNERHHRDPAGREVPSRLVLCICN